MRITRKDKILNTPTLIVRNFLRKHKDSRDFTFRQFHESMVRYLDDTPLLLATIIDEGYIEDNGKGCYEVTQKGRSLCLAKCHKPLNKDAADRIFSEFMARVHAVNSDDNYLYRVKTVLLFGSYIDPQAVDFGDIDIVVELERRFDYEVFKNKDDEMVREAQANGKEFRSIVEELAYTHDIVIKALKNRNRYISMHRMYDIEGLKCPYKQVFP